MSIGENIRELRQRAGLTQAQFAQKLGVTKETVCRWERDATTIRKRHVDQLVRIFDIVPDDILSSSGGLASRRDLPLPSNNLHDNPPHPMQNVLASTILISQRSHFRYIRSFPPHRAPRSSRAGTRMHRPTSPHGILMLRSSPHLRAS